MDNTVETTIGGDAGMRPTVFSAARRVLGLRAARFLFRMFDMVAPAGMARRRPLFGSIDSTCRRNLKGKHCCFAGQGYDCELNDGEWIAFFDRLKWTTFPFWQCSWVGWDPLLRRDRERRAAAANMP